MEKVQDQIRCISDVQTIGQTGSKLIPLCRPLILMKNAFINVQRSAKHAPQYFLMITYGLFFKNYLTYFLMTTYVNFVIQKVLLVFLMTIYGPC